MKIISEDDKEKAKKMQLYIMDEIHNICMKNDIDYSFIGGTLLGAIRHKDFIPWDDDLDIGMTRIEYEKFMIAAKKELKNDFFLQSLDTENNYPFAFAKVRLQNTIWEDSVIQDLEINKGVFVDVFPYDNVPLSKYKRFFQKFAIILIKKIILSKINYFAFSRKTLLYKFCFYFFKTMSLFVSINKLVRVQQKIMKLYNNKKTNSVANMGGGYTYEKQTMPSSLFNEFKQTRFNDREYQIFKTPNIYLSHLYGDFMQLPPENERVFRHDIVNFRFDFKLKDTINPSINNTCL